MDPLLEQLLAGFVDEAQEIYERVTRSLMELEKSPAQGPSFDELARGLHTLKGSAATLGLEELADFAHRMEDVILPLRGSAKPLPATVADAVLKSLDVWMARLRAIAAKGELPELGPSFVLLEKVKPAGAGTTKKKNGAGKNGKGGSAWRSAGGSWKRPSCSSTGWGSRRRRRRRARCCSECGARWARTARRRRTSSPRWRRVSRRSPRCRCAPCSIPCGAPSATCARRPGSKRGWPWSARRGLWTAA